MEVELDSDTSTIILRIGYEPSVLFEKDIDVTHGASTFALSEVELKGPLTLTFFGFVKTGMYVGGQTYSMPNNY